MLVKCKLVYTFCCTFVAFIHKTNRYEKDINLGSLIGLCYGSHSPKLWQTMGTSATWCRKRLATVGLKWCWANTRQGYDWKQWYAVAACFTHVAHLWRTRIARFSTSLRKRHWANACPRATACNESLAACRFGTMLCQHGGWRPHNRARLSWAVKTTLCRFATWFVGLGPS